MFFLFFLCAFSSFAPWRELSSPAPSPWPLAPRLGLRNVARRPARLALTVAALALAGALFMATFGLRLGLYEAIEILVGEFPSDVIIDLEQPQAVGRLRRIAEDVETEFLGRNSVSSRLELWGVADARRLYADGRAGSSFTLYGVPPTTQIAPFAERAGNWLLEEERDAEERRGARRNAEEERKILPPRLSASSLRVSPRSSPLPWPLAWPGATWPGGRRGWR